MLRKNIISRIVENVVREYLTESRRGIQSQKLYDIIQKYGKWKHGGPLDVHNMVDDDVIGVLTSRQVEDIQRGHTVDRWRWADNYGLDKWAKANGWRLEPGDRVDWCRLGDYEHCLVYIVRNAELVNGREGEGFDIYHRKREERANNHNSDGAKRYISPNHRLFDWSRMWKNPYKKDWSDDDIRTSMERLRQQRAERKEKEKNSKDN